MRARSTLLGLAVAPLLVGCDAITNHPAVPYEVGQVMRESVYVLGDLRGDVEQFLAGFNLRSNETSAAQQLVGAMFLFFQAKDAGEVVRAAIEFKRAQACLALTGIDSSGVVNDIMRFVLADEGRRKNWEAFEQWYAANDIPDFSGAACDYNRTY